MALSLRLYVGQGLRIGEDIDLRITRVSGRSGRTQVTLAVKAPRNQEIVRIDADGRVLTGSSKQEAPT